MINNYNIHSQMENPDKFICVEKIDQMEPARIKELETAFRARSNIWNQSTVGFIAPTDNLLEVYAKDISALNASGITLRQIADVLTTITNKYKYKHSLIESKSIGDANVNYQPQVEQRHLTQLKDIDEFIMKSECNGGYSYCHSIVKNSFPIVIDDRYIITREMFWGYQCCPFSSNSSREKHGGGSDYWIYDTQTKESIQFNDLLIHLIRDHGFFEGNVFHRLDPLKVIKFFNLRPGVSYAANYETVSQYQKINVGGDISPCRKEGDHTMYETWQSDDILYVKITQRNPSDKFLELVIDDVPLKRDLRYDIIAKYKKKIAQQIIVDINTI